MEPQCRGSTGAGSDPSPASGSRDRGREERGTSESDRGSWGPAGSGRARGAGGETRGRLWRASKGLGRPPLCSCHGLGRRPGSGGAGVLGPPDCFLTATCPQPPSGPPGRAHPLFLPACRGRLLPHFTDPQHHTPSQPHPWGPAGTWRPCVIPDNALTRPRLAGVAGVPPPTPSALRGWLMEEPGAWGRGAMPLGCLESSFHCSAWEATLAECPFVLLRTLG